MSITTSETIARADLVSRSAPATRARTKRIGIALLVVAYAAFWGATGLPQFNATDFDVFFLPSAIIAANGHPLHIYTVRYLTTYPNANGPLAIAPLALVAWLGAHMGWLANTSIRRAVAQTVFSVFSLLLAREAVLASDRLLSRPLRGWRRLLAYALFALSPELWHSVLFYGHLEQPLMLWLTLAGTRALVERRPGRAGLLMGLALLTRSTALIYLAPLALLLLCHRRWKATSWLLGGAGATVGLGLLPFWLADRGDLVYSLVSFRDTLPIGGGSFWRLALDTPWQRLATHYDSLAALLAAVAITLLIVRVRRDLDVDSRGVYALLAVSSLCFILGMRTVWPYYFLDAYVFLGIWWLCGLPRGQAWRAVARWWLGVLLLALVVIYGQIGEYEVDLTNNGTWDVRSSVTLSSLVTALLVGMVVWIWRSRMIQRPVSQLASSAANGELA